MQPTVVEAKDKANISFGSKAILVGVITHAGEEVSVLISVDSTLSIHVSSVQPFGVAIDVTGLNQNLSNTTLVFTNLNLAIVNQVYLVSVRVDLGV